jgi:hypothetical protein
MRGYQKTLSTLIVTSATLIGVASCSDSAGTSTSTDTSSQSSTLTTELSQPPCSLDAFTAAFGEQSYEPFCVDEWAVAQPRSYVESCQDCESLWLFQWNSETWELRGTCYQFAPITADSAPCSTPDGNELQEYPPVDVACALWPANTFEENLAVTNCGN